jgi:hypothetical protein
MEDKRNYCPIHKKRLVITKTRFGPRGDCPENGCTVVLWYNDETALPADEETRKARHNVHVVFDPLWQTGKFKRTKLYKMLSSYMRLKPKKTHIGMFTKEQCEKAIEFVNSLHHGTDLDRIHY